MSDIALQTIADEIRTAAQQLITVAGLGEGDLLVVGCSTSEVMGGVIGKAGSTDVAAVIADTLLAVLQPLGINLAAQCCEHLNRALVLSADVARVRNLAPVTVVPQPHAGGAFASAVYRKLSAPVVVEAVAADAGMDIGDTLIGMHLKTVAVPVRLTVNSIGRAHLVCARTRPKYIGGPRAVYTLDEA